MQQTHMQRHVHQAHYYMSPYTGNIKSGGKIPKEEDQYLKDAFFQCSATDPLRVIDNILTTNGFRSTTHDPCVYSVNVNRTNVFF